MSILQVIFLLFSLFLFKTVYHYFQKKRLASRTTTNPEVKNKDTLADKHMGKHILAPDLTRLQQTHMFQSIAVVLVLQPAWVKTYSYGILGKISFSLMD